MASRNTQLNSTKTQLESIKSEYQEKEESAKKQIEKLNAELISLKSSQTCKSESTLSGSAVNSDTDVQTWTTLQKEL